MQISKDTSNYLAFLVFLACTFFIAFAFSDAQAGEGPEADTTTKLHTVPNGYKLVPIDHECKQKDPCEKYKVENDALKKEVARLKKEIQNLVAEANEQPECPKCKPEIRYVDKIKEVSVEKKIEVEKPTFKKNVVRLIGAIGQDGIETSSSDNDPYAKDAYVYYNGLVGLGYTRFFDDSFGLGLFGMMGGINKTAGLSAEIAF